MIHCKEDAVADYLAKLTEVEVAAFYRRLANNISLQFKGDSLAATLLLHWLDGKGDVLVFPARYVNTLLEVREYLRETARPIFLSQKATPSGGIGGVVPRIKGKIASNPPMGPYAMHLEGNVEASVSIQAKAYMGMAVDPRELDALYALHGFTLISDVVASATPTSPPGSYQVKFTRWMCSTTDYYHWNPDKHISVPNPDFGSTASGAVAPKDREITVYHSNAIRVEKAGLAKPFTSRSELWDESDPNVVGPATFRP